MYSWQWNEIASRFMDLTATSEDEELNRTCEEDARLCQELLQRVIDEEQRSGSQPSGEPHEFDEEMNGVSEFADPDDEANTVSYM